MHRFIFILILSLFKGPSQSLTDRKGTYFNIDLIHRDSPLSPFYDPSITQSERMKKATLHSLNRANFFHSSMHINGKRVMSPLIEIEGEYIMKIYIGYPPIEFLAIADTRNNLIWTQCASSHINHHRNGKFFNPLQSTTYDVVPYGSEFCEALQENWSGLLNSYKYNETYRDGSYTIGIPGNDTIYLTKASNEVIDLRGVVFGCSEQNYLHDANFGIRYYWPWTRVVIVNFSIENLNRTFPRSSSIMNKLRLGVEAKIYGTEVVSTRLVPDDPFEHYCIKLEVLTILHTSFYNDLKALVENVIHDSPVLNPPEQYNLCYDVESINLDDIPEMIFHFTSADLRLTYEDAFTTYEDSLICMKIVPNDHLSILRSLAQVDFQVEIDLQNSQVSFAEANCSAF
ncbi:probable aspartic protease At2g35615 [Tripterygium wilfordii]|uniref:probable aspartic protease At2g35615 n=1 Tax=Tripterygium wilfordii TaxID=458696 RepID=UPI0018F84C68|nr:probable aspartic protease At2g35615 [Tripterygium wilfordii]